MENIGKILKKARKSRNLKLETLSKVLKISIDYLQSIENGNSKNLPGEPYNWGFIKTYSNYLNLDIDYIYNLYKNENNIVIKSKELHLPTFTNNYQLNYLKYGFLGILTTILLYTFYNFFYLQTNLDERYALTPEPDEVMLAQIEEEELKRSIEEIKKFKIKQKEEQKNSLESSKIYETATNEKIDVSNINSANANFNQEISENINNKITLKLLNDTWIQIKGPNEEIIISKLMKKNEEFILNTYEYYFITTGNAGNVKILIDNKNYGKLGKKGEVLNSFKLTEDFNNL